MLYQSAKIGNELMAEAEIARHAGLEVSTLSATEIQSMEFDAKPMFQEECITNQMII